MTAHRLLPAAAILAAATVVHAQTPRITYNLSRAFLPTGIQWMMFGDYAQIVLSVSFEPPVGTQIAYTPPPGSGIGTVVGLGRVEFDLIACRPISGDWTLQGEGFQGTTGTTWGVRSGWYGDPGLVQPNGDLLLCSAGQLAFPGFPVSAANPVNEIWRARWDPDRIDPGARMRLTLYPRVSTLMVRYGTGPTGQALYVEVAAAAAPVSIEFLLDLGGPPPCYTFITEQPQSIAVAAGSPATFHVGLSQVPGQCPPMTVQWRRNCQALVDGGRVSGATTNTLRIDPVAPTDAGQYDAVASVGAMSDGAWLTVACYANCDQSTTAPVLNAADFGCFLNRYAAGDPYANCDGSTSTPVLNVGDLSCFLNQFAAGCP